MSMSKCLECEGFGKIYKISDPPVPPYAFEYCFKCNGSGRTWKIGSTHMAGDWMNVEWEKGITPIEKLRKQIQEDPALISHEELAIAFERLAIVCDNLWHAYNIIKHKTNTSWR